MLYASTQCELPGELLEAIAILQGSQVASYSLKTGQALLDARAQAVVHAATNEQWRQVAEIFCVLNQDPVAYAYLEKKCEEQGLLSNGKCFSSDPATAAKILYDTLTRHLCSWKGGPGSVAAAWISDAACNAAILALTLAQWQCSSSPHDNGDGAAANTTVTILGREIVLRGGTDDHKIYKEIFEKRVYEKETYRTAVGSEQLGFKIEKDEVVLDLGANVGLFALYALQAGAGKIICVEGYPTLSSS